MEEKPLFKEKFFAAFQEWEKTQPKKRSTFTAFADWLSDNSMNVKIKQQNVDSWMGGTIPKDYKFVSILAEKLGDWIYESLNVKPSSTLPTNKKKMKPQWAPGAACAIT